MAGYGSALLSLRKTLVGLRWLNRHIGKMTAHARLFLRVSSRAVCEWTLEGENEASFSPNVKPSVDGNEFYYLKRHWDFDRDTSGVIF